SPAAAATPPAARPGRCRWHRPGRPGPGRAARRSSAAAARGGRTGGAPRPRAPPARRGSGGHGSPATPAAWTPPLIGQDSPQSHRGHRGKTVKSKKENVIRIKSWFIPPFFILCPLAGSVLSSLCVLCDSVVDLGQGFGGALPHFDSSVSVASQARNSFSI